MFILSILLGPIIILLKANNPNGQELGIRHLHNDLILAIESGKCRIETGNLNIIHSINLTDLEETMHKLTTTAYSRLKEDNPIRDIIKHKIKELYSNFIQIKPNIPTRWKRWDAIGTTWKWIAGNPDAHDLRIINSTLNHLIDENNVQYKVNNQMSKRIQQLTNTVNKMLERSHTNEIILNEIESLILVLNIDMVNKIIVDIQDAIILSKQKMIHNRLLSARESNFIQNSLAEQGIKTDIPEEALNYASPKIVISKESLLYIVRVPVFSRETSVVIKVFPLNQNNTVIRNLPIHLVKNGKRFYTTNTPDNYIQRSSHLNDFKDSCICPLLLGTQSHCVTETGNTTEAKLVADNIILITNAKKDVVSSNCGPDNRTLDGNLILTFENCTVMFKNTTFSAKQITQSTSLFQSALHNIQVNRTNIKNFDIEAIENLTFENRHKLNHVILKQFSINYWTWGTIGGSIFSTITIVSIIFFILSNHKSLINRIITKRSRKNKHLHEPKSAEVSNPLDA